MAHRPMEEDKQEMQMVPKAGTTPKQKEVTQVVVLPPNDDVIFKSLKGTSPRGWPLAYVTALHATGMTTTTMPTYSSSPMPGGMSK